MDVAEEYGGAGTNPDKHKQTKTSHFFLEVC